MENVKFSATKTNNDKKIVYMYTDGGCRINAQKGEKVKETDKCAYAFFLKQGGHEKLDGYASYGETNGAMEIKAVLMGLRAIKIKNIPVEIYSDSAYVVNTLNNKWYIKWESNGWDKKGGLANSQLWKELIEEYRKFPFISVNKVKGHSTNKWNNLVDAHLNKLMDELPEKGVK